MWQTSSCVIFLLRLCVVFRTQLGVNGNPISSLLLWLWWAPLLRVLWVYANYSSCAYSHLKLRAWILEPSYLRFECNEMGDGKVKNDTQTWNELDILHTLKHITCVKIYDSSCLLCLSISYRNVYQSGHNQNAERVYVWHFSFEIDIIPKFSGSQYSTWT